MRSRQVTCPRITQKSDPPFVSSVRTFRDHPRCMDMFGLLAASLLLLQFLLDPVLEVGDRITTDAKFDEM